MSNFTVTSSAFLPGGKIPTDYTARGADRSPGFQLRNIAAGAQSLAITMDDADHPLIKNFNHWLIWNLPVQNIIPEGVPKGETVPALAGAVQGLAYGRHCYKGPKPPLHSNHQYCFTFYVLDCPLSLPANSRKRALLAAMQGHVLQTATLCGTYQTPRGAR
ncbi:MAG: hypothetical protein PWQ08_43 [Clostridiales bacterium]|jgi:hypothetical protein|nr:hypothetical protein [Clostridiales bacterium]